MPVELIPPEQQIVRKKAEEKLYIPKTKEPKEELMVSLEKRERLAGVPIVPGDPCCANLCEILNNKIERKRDLLNATIIYGGGRGLQKSATYRSMMYQIESLENHRQDLKEKGSCGCIAETGAVSIIVPLVQAATKEEIPPVIGLRLIAPPPKKFRERYLTEKSIIPPTNSCCPTSCNILNKEIDTTSKILDNMELRGGYEALKNPRFEALSAKVFSLQDYRTELKNRLSCKCVE